MAVPVDERTPGLDPEDDRLYRGALCKTLLKTTRRELWGEAALSRVSPENIQAIESCRGLSWLPANVLDAVNLASLAEAGREGYVDFWRRYTVRARDSVLIGPFVSGAMRIFGRRPEGFLRWTGRAREATTKNYGSVAVTGEPGSVQLSLIDIPPAGRIATAAASLEGSAYGVFDLCRHECTIRVDETRMHSHGIVHVVATWDAASE